MLSLKKWNRSEQVGTKG